MYTTEAPPRPMHRQFPGGPPLTGLAAVSTVLFLTGLIEMWIEDPDGRRVVLVEVPAGHPLRHDPRPALPPRRRSPSTR